MFLHLCAFRRLPLTVPLVIALLNVHLAVFAFMIDNPKGKSVTYSLLNSEYGKRIVAEVINADQQQAASGRVELAPTYHLGHQQAEEEDGEDAEPDSNGFPPQDDGSYKPHLYTPQTPVPRYGSKETFGEPKSLRESQYPSMMPQIQKVLFESQTAHATPRPKGPRRQKAPNRSSGLSSAPQQQEPQQFFQYLHFGPTATTPRTVTEAPEKDFLSRPFFDDITPKPRIKTNKFANYETNIESPPSKATGPVATSYQKMILYSHPAKSAETSSPIPDDFPDFVRHGPPPQTPSSSSSFDGEQFDDQDDQGDNFETTESPFASLSLNHGPPPASSPRAESHYSPPKKFNPANSVISGPNSFMTLSFEPISEKQKHSPGRSRSSYKHQKPMSSPAHGSNERHSPPATQVIYHTQTHHPLPSGQSTEDQQEPPNQAHHFGHSYSRPGLHDAPSYRSGKRKQPEQYSHFQSQMNQPQMASYSQHSPEWQQQQAQAEPSQPESSPADDEPVQRPTHYRSYQRRQPTSQAEGHSQSYAYRPQGGQHPNYPATTEQALASEVEQKYDFSESVQKYAKEFGFEIPSQNSKQNSAPSKRSRSVPPKADNAQMLSSAPAEALVPSAHPSAKNESHFYFNMIFPEFAPEFKEYQQPQQESSPLSRYEAVHGAATQKQSPNPDSASTFTYSESSHKTTPEKEKELQSIISFARSLQDDEPGTGESGGKATAKSPADDARQADNISKSEVEHILHKYNEVISHKQKVVRGKDGTETTETQ